MSIQTWIEEQKAATARAQAWAREQQQQMEAEILACEKVRQRVMSDDEPLKRIQREIEKCDQEAKAAAEDLRGKLWGQDQRASYRDSVDAMVARNDRQKLMDSAKAYSDSVDAMVERIRAMSTEPARKLARIQAEIAKHDQEVKAAQRKAFEDQALYGTGVVSQAMAAGAMAADGSWYGTGVSNKAAAAIGATLKIRRPEPFKSFTNVIQQLRDLRDTQRSSCDCVGDSYFRGLYNGMELALATLENREPQYIEAPAPVLAPSTALLVEGRVPQYSGSISMGQYAKIIEACKTQAADPEPTPGVLPANPNLLRWT